jgi:AraC family transcriptional regulator of adaptative response/methylated-DNA-[protein]-cysteine methyltransferase
MPGAGGEYAVYGVASTGIYCRPGCPAKKPRPENLRYFESNEAAERSGFRPCKRCRPDIPDRGAEHREAVVRACALIEAAEEAPDFVAIAAAAGMSRYHFHRVFKALTGLTPGAYGKAVRERRALRELSNTDTVTDAIYNAGYGSSGRFYETMAWKLGLRPSSYAKGGTGETIFFAVGECSHGSLLVAATAKGLCAIELGDSPGALVESFQDRFPNADLRGGDPDFEGLIAQVAAVVDEPWQPLEVPLHVRGTAFQHKLWRALQEIPAGETRTYAQMATQIGNPAAVRAVANACAANRVAVAIPCHRVVRTDGSLSGYRWGVERKRALLLREGAGRAKRYPREP